MPVLPGAGEGCMRQVRAWGRLGEAPLWPGPRGREVVQGLVTGVPVQGRGPPSANPLQCPQYSTERALRDSTSVSPQDLPLYSRKVRQWG